MKDKMEIIKDKRGVMLDKKYVMKDEMGPCKGKERCYIEEEGF
jgi:hypothetical protein